MPRVPEKTVEEVVEDVSKRMADPSYGQIAIGTFAQQHPDVGRFLTAHVDELGGGEAVMHAVFHAHVLNECFERAVGGSLSPIGFADLDHASTDDDEEAFRQRQPALATYVATNLDEGAGRRLLSLVGLAMSEM